MFQGGWGFNGRQCWVNGVITSNARWVGVGVIALMTMFQGGWGFNGVRLKVGGGFNGVITSINVSRWVGSLMVLPHL